MKKFLFLLSLMGILEIEAARSKGGCNPNCFMYFETADQDDVENPLIPRYVQNYYREQFKTFSPSGWYLKSSMINNDGIYCPKIGSKPVTNQKLIAQLEAAQKAKIVTAQQLAEHHKKQQLKIHAAQQRAEMYPVTKLQK